MSSRVQTDGQGAGSPMQGTFRSLVSAARGSTDGVPVGTVRSPVAPLALVCSAGVTVLLAFAALNGFPLVGIALLAVAAGAMALAVLKFPRLAQKGAIAAATVFAGTVAWIASHTGGLWSPFLLVLAILPVEAALTRDIRVVRWVFALVGLACALVAGVATQVASAIPVGEATLFALVGSAALYALSLALRISQTSAMRDLHANATRRAIDQFHAVTHDIFVIVGRDGRVDQAFGAVDTILECQPTDLFGNGFVDRLHIADRPRVLAILDRVHVMNGRDTVEARLRKGTADKPQGFLWTEIDLSSVQGANGAAEIYALVRDIHAAKDNEAQLTLARDKAEASDAAKGRFLASMSHELRTPLNAIIGFADILDEEVFGELANEQQREYVTLIRDSGSHLLQLVNDLLDMSKLDTGHFHIVAEPFALGTVIDRCVKLMQGQIDKAELTLKLDKPAKLSELVADQRAVRQILINLLSNACKFTEPGGTITLRVRQDTNQMILSVADNGIGIAPEDVKRLGEPFFQANAAYDRNHHGTGLGLSVVKGLCELHEGELSISSVEGEGTTVAVRLPLAGPSGRQEAGNNPAVTQANNSVVFAKLDRERAATASVSQEPDRDDTQAEPNTAHQQDERKRAHG